MVTQAAEAGPLDTLGPLIHNPQVVAKLQQSGVRAIASLDDAQSGKVVFPSHGVPQDVREDARRRRLEVVDATCPFVRKVQQRAKHLAKEGYKVVVVGDAQHSEVRGILSAAGPDAVAVTSAEEVANIQWPDKVGVVAQTTQLTERFAQVVSALACVTHEVRAFNTICYATFDRQQAALDLAGNVEVMFVVGGRNSANTARLRELCEERGVPTYHVETADEICGDWALGKSVAGLTAGASTPDWIIEEVRRKLGEMG